MSDPKKTPLCEEHIKAGAKMVEFAGWYMPVEYQGLKQEHLAVRSHVGLFDVSHMGEVFVRGPKALETLQWLTTNDVSTLEEGRAHYSLLPNKTGGLVDDIIVYCLKKNQEYMVCVNAANKDKDFNWMVQNNKGAELKDESDQWSQIAIQGPQAMELTQKSMKTDLSTMKPFDVRQVKFDGVNTLIAKTGYTGEDGCEVFIPNTKAVQLWRTLLEVGKAYGVTPIGLGARDTLRLEMKFSLYGHEIDDHSNPIEAGLGWVVKLNKGNFIGKELIERVKQEGPKKHCIGFKLKDKGIPRQGYILKSFDNREIGKVTSGTLSPSLSEAIGIGYVETKYAPVGTEILVDIRGRGAKAVVVKTPFVKAGGK